MFPGSTDSQTTNHLNQKEEFDLNFTTVILSSLFCDDPLPMIPLMTPSLLARGSRPHGELAVTLRSFHT